LQNREEERRKVDNREERGEVMEVSKETEVERRREDRDMKTSMRDEKERE
jgi:hypothetical protein